MRFWRSAISSEPAPTIRVDAHNIGNRGLGLLIVSSVHTIRSLLKCAIFFPWPFRWPSSHWPTFAGSQEISEVNS
jgi:hypothetical protein